MVGIGDKSKEIFTLFHVLILKKAYLLLIQR